MSIDGTIIVTALLMGLVTVPARFLPFLIGHRLNDPALRRMFADLFPPAVLAVLIVYLGWGAAQAPLMEQLAQLAGVAVTVAAHLTLRNLLISVGGGTAVCMLIQNLL